MIPQTFPSTVSSLTGRRELVGYALSSVAGLTRWVDYIPVKYSTSSNEQEEGLTNARGFIALNLLTSSTGLTSFSNYIPVYFDAAATKPWECSDIGYIPLGYSGLGGGANYGYNMVNNGDYFSTPNAVANQITGDLTIIIDCALNNWTPAAVEVLVAKDSVSAGGRSYALNIQTSGAPRLNFSVDGTNIVSVTATAATGFTNGYRKHIAVERESATGKVRFYTSNDHITWKLLGTEQTSTTGNIFAGNAAVQFGNLASLSYALNGKVFDSEIYAGLAISGTATLKVDFDPSNYVSGTTWTSADTGEVWTINGGALVKKV